MPGARAVAQPFAGATANALAWLYGRYQEEVKINALREATQRMNPHVEAAAEMFGNTASAAELPGRTAGVRAADDAADRIAKIGKVANPITQVLGGVEKLGKQIEKLNEEEKETA